MFYKYPHIGQFRDVVDYINHNYEENLLLYLKEQQNFMEQMERLFIL